MLGRLLGLLKSVPPAEDAVASPPRQLFEERRFSVDFKPGENDADLVVLLSSSRNHMMHRRPFRCDALFIAPQRSPYYLRDADRLANSIYRFTKDYGYQRVALVGGSKSGFGALLLAGLLAKKHPNGFFRALAFSPQVRLFPFDDSFYFPSYKSMYAASETNEGLRKCLIEHGDQSDLGSLRNLHATLVYGEGNDVDVAQCALISGPNIRKLPVHTDVHNTTMFFGTRKFDEAAVKAKLAKIYADKDDEDIAASKPKDVDAIIRQMVDATWLPTLDDLLEQVLSVKAP